MNIIQLNNKHKLNIWFRLYFLRKIKWYLRQIFHRSNIIKIPTLEKKAYYDPDYVLLHGMMAVLVDFVETSSFAYFAYVDYYNTLPFYKKFILDVKYFFIPFRSSKFGIIGLQNMSESIGFPEEQIKFTKECLKIYDWWKNIYPSREDPIDLSGYGELIENETGNIIEKPLSPAHIDLLNEMAKIEQEQLDEENEMLHRLIEIRLYLWD